MYRKIIVFASIICIFLGESVFGMLYKPSKARGSQTIEQRMKKDAQDDVLAEKFVCGILSRSLNTMKFDKLPDCVSCKVLKNCGGVLKIRKKNQSIVFPGLQLPQL